jgi:hypothetical protein
MVMESMQLVSIIPHRLSPGRRVPCSRACHRLMYLHINNHLLVLAVYQLPAANSFLQLGVFERIQLPTPSFSVIRMGIASNRH